MIGNESPLNKTSILERILNPKLKTLIPPLSKEEYAGLEASIIAEGCRDAIVVWRRLISAKEMWEQGYGTCKEESCKYSYEIVPHELWELGDGIWECPCGRGIAPWIEEYIIVDGHNRYEICTRNNIPFRIDRATLEDFEERDDVKIWIIKNQFSRRNISTFQRAELALSLDTLFSESAKRNQGTRTDLGFNFTPREGESPRDRETARKIAEVAGVGHNTISQVKRIIKDAPPDLIQEVRFGEKSIKEAYKEIRAAEKAEQKQIAIDQINSLTTPTGKYHVLVVDPPWQYEKRAEDTTHRGRCLYPTMSIAEICNIEIPAEDNAVLWLWTTNAFIHDAYHIVESWEFTPKTVLTWVKDRMGVGDWLRGQTEHCILAVRGKPVIDLTNQTTVLNAPLREHSRKPDEFYDMVSSLCPGRKIDMFSREPREGWDQWGGEVDKF